MPDLAGDDVAEQFPRLAETALLPAAICD